MGGGGVTGGGPARQRWRRRRVVGGASQGQRCFGERRGAWHRTWSGKSNGGVDVTRRSTMAVKREGEGSSAGERKISIPVRRREEKG